MKEIFIKLKNGMYVAATDVEFRWGTDIDEDGVRRWEHLSYELIDATNGSLILDEEVYTEVKKNHENIIYSTWYDYAMDNGYPYPC